MGRNLLYDSMCGIHNSLNTPLLQIGSLFPFRLLIMLWKRRFQNILIKLFVSIHILEFRDDIYYTMEGI